MILNILLQVAFASLVDMIGMGGIFMIVALFMIMWIRPQKRQKEIKKQRAALKTDDKMVTSGSLHDHPKERTTAITSLKTAKINTNMETCPRCGAPINSQNICEYCGGVFFMEKTTSTMNTNPSVKIEKWLLEYVSKLSDSQLSKIMKTPQKYDAEFMQAVEREIRTRDAS